VSFALPPLPYPALKLASLPVRDSMAVHKPRPSSQVQSTTRRPLNIAVTPTKIKTNFFFKTALTPIGELSPNPFKSEDVAHSPRTTSSPVARSPRVSPLSHSQAPISSRSTKKQIKFQPSKIIEYMVENKEEPKRPVTPLTSNGSRPDSSSSYSLEPGTNTSGVVAALENMQQEATTDSPLSSNLFDSALEQYPEVKLDLLTEATSFTMSRFNINVPSYDAGEAWNLDVLTNPKLLKPTKLSLRRPTNLKITTLSRGFSKLRLPKKDTSRVSTLSKADTVISNSQHADTLLSPVNVRWDVQVEGERVVSFYGDVLNAYYNRDDLKSPKTTDTGASTSADAVSLSKYVSPLPQSPVSNPSPLTAGPLAPVRRQLETCAFCSKQIEGKPVFLLGRLWHKHHAQCASCARPLGVDNFAEIDGLIYCEYHYRMHNPKPVRFGGASNVAGVNVKKVRNLLKFDKQVKAQGSTKVSRERRF
jgi:LIM domain